MDRLRRRTEVEGRSPQVEGREVTIESSGKRQRHMGLERMGRQADDASGEERC